MQPKYVTKELKHVPAEKVPALEKLFKLEGAMRINIEPDKDDGYNVKALFDTHVLEEKKPVSS